MKKNLLICALIFSLSNCETVVEKKVEKKEENLSENHYSLFGHEEAPFLFAQRGATASFDGKILTVNRVNYTDYFSNKNRKFIKQVSNKDFFANWQEGKTAVISYQNKDRTTDAATLELSKPKLGKRNAVSYSTKVVSGKLPKITSEVAIFIDSTQGME